MKNKIKTSPKKNGAIKLQSLVHSSHSYVIFHHKLENWQDVDLLWAVYLNQSRHLPDGIWYEILKITLPTSFYIKLLSGNWPVLMGSNPLWNYIIFSKMLLSKLCIYLIIQMLCLVGQHDHWENLEVETARQNCY